MEQSAIIKIGKYLVSSEILTEFFCCDYQQCKGACCIIGDGGAPLKPRETFILKHQFSKFKKYMRPEGIQKVEQDGFSETDSDGDLLTPLVGNKGECAYTLFEDGNCLCAIERAHIKGDCSFVKPISCRLYPIRVSKLSNGLTALNLHRWSICQCAFQKGKQEKVLVYQFLREPIEAAFGKRFYASLEAAAKALR